MDSFEVALAIVPSGWTVLATDGARIFAVRHAPDGLGSTYVTWQVGLSVEGGRVVHSGYYRMNRNAAFQFYFGGGF